MSTRICLGAAMLAIASQSVSADPTVTRFNGVGLLPGCESSLVNAISADGLTAVGFSQSALSIEAFAWTRTGGLRPLLALSGDTGSTATGASGDGMLIVGQSGSSSNPRAVQWAPGPSCIALPTLGSPGTSHIRGVSSSGSVIVGDTIQSGTFTAARWSAGGIQLLGSLAPGRESQAAAASADGSVIVGRSQTPSGNLVVATRWVLPGSPSSLGVLPGGSTSFASATSADGSVVVGAGNAAGAFSHAFLWTQGRGMVDLGALPGSGSAYALAVSADGSTVGGYSNVGTDHAFVWKQDLGMEDLNTYLPSLGIDLTDWTLTQVTSISADGLTFAGVGVHRLSPTFARYEGFVATIPQPATAAVLLCGVLVRGRRRQR